MSRYKHTQIGYVTVGALGAAALATYFADRDRPSLFSRLTTGSLALAGVLFSSLTVRVEADALQFYFGPGFWERKISLAHIRSVEVVRNDPLYGWGIHYTPHGWLYNVSGLDAVEVQTASETFRLGTDEPARLKRALEDARTALTNES